MGQGHVYRAAFPQSVVAQRSAALAVSQSGVGVCGLSRLFSALYGIRFRASMVAPGEVWSEGRET